MKFKCPKCGTVQQISKEDPRICDGYVNCQQCGKKLRIFTPEEKKTRPEPSLTHLNLSRVNTDQTETGVHLIETTQIESKVSFWNLPVARIAFTVGIVVAGIVIYFIVQNGGPIDDAMSSAIRARAEAERRQAGFYAKEAYSHGLEFLSKANEMKNRGDTKAQLEYLQKAGREFENASRLSQGEPAAVIQTVRSYYLAVQQKRVDDAVNMYSSQKKTIIKRELIQAVATDTDYYTFDKIDVTLKDSDHASTYLILRHKKYRFPEETWEITVELVKENGQWMIWSSPGRKL